jgi:DNA polymerase-1
MNNNKKTITVIDTFGFLFRSYYALPPLRAKNGFPTGLLTGFMNFISNLGKDFQTDYIVFALDSKGDTFRNDIYKEYKAHRPDVPDDLKKQLPIAIAWIESMGFATAAQVGYEADDVIASIVADAKHLDMHVRIVSHDKDLYQLIDDEHDIFMFDPIKKVEVRSNYCFEKYGVRPDQFTDYQSLLGDSADNVPGVKGVGAKTAQALIEQFDTLDNIYANLENIEKKRWKTLLTDSNELAFISKQLVTLHTDAYDLEISDDILLPLENPILKIQDTLIEFNMERIVQRVNSDGLNYKTSIPKKKEKLQYEAILLNNEDELFDIINNISKDSIVAFDTETTAIDVTTANIVGFSFCIDDTVAYYVPISHSYLGVPDQISKEIAKDAIIKLNEYKLVLQNYKYDYEIIKRNFDIELILYVDTMILAWLLDSSSAVGLDKLSLKYFDHQMIAFKDVVKKGQDFSSIDVDKACEYAAEDALITFKLYYKLLEKIKEDNNQDLLEEAFEIEFPFVDVILEMQRNGITIDTGFFEILKDKNKIRLKELESEIYNVSGTQFNINSPKQLGVVLFETLQLPPSKKTKTGYSTNESVLSSLKDEHIVIKYLLEYRQLAKLQSTYVEPLLNLALEDNMHRVYTSFLQTGTATGRLSSKNPNLQNIPVRTKQGREIREGFIASEGKVLVGIDYSQIELRLLAHFSKDKALMDAFNNGLDIHRQTAVHIFGEELADEKRNIAKSINFGLLYGMGARKLGETLGIPAKEAKVYIESYFEAFPTIKEYLKSIEQYVLENGFVSTLLKRKRFFDFENANGMQKAGFLREAVNTVFQGSAADLIKLSMNEIYKQYKNNNDMKILLQIHDELIFEVDEEKVDNIKDSLLDIMTNIYKLDVPLECSVSVSKSWGGLK